MRHAIAVLVAVVFVPGATHAIAPPVVSWRDAAGHVGEVVTVEGEVTAARTTGEACILEFTDDPRALRVVLLLPLFGSAPREPDRLYRGKRIRATGRVQRFQGRPEMVLRGPDQIELLDRPEAEREAPVAPPTVPTVPAEPPPAAPPISRRAVPQAAPCERARARWRAAAEDAAARMRTLSRCLEAMGYRCRAERTALAPALAALDSIEQQIEDACR